MLPYNPYNGQTGRDPYDGYSQPTRGAMNYQSSSPAYPPMVQAPPQLPVRGRLVDSPDEIRPQEIPQDLAPSFFPRSDYKVIYAKAWDQNGTLRHFEFVPKEETPNAPAQSPEVYFQQFGQMLSQLSSRIDALETNIADILRPFTTTDTKKEV